ncbi:MAG: hypothetical protein JWP34_1553 [Massilia sp.]|nr:hypothetical protein [Massilia sp.]
MPGLVSNDATIGKYRELISPQLEKKKENPSARAASHLEPQEFYRRPDPLGTRV